MTSNPIPLIAPTRSQAAGPAGRVVIDTHGCKLNQADSSVLARQFRQAGYLVVSDVRDADIFVLNTCTVTATADSKARQALRAARRSNPDAVVVAAGCYPQRAATELSQMPAVSLVVGNEDKHRLADMAIAAHRQRLGLDWEALDTLAGPLNQGTVTGHLPGRSRGMVKIQEGCNQVCAYCIVPKVRGRERSIPQEQVVAHVLQRLEDGCVEVALTGTQLGTYGFDLPSATLQGLIRRILNETDVARLRVSSLQAQEIDRDLLQLWLDDPRLCPHFHIPLQSGSDRVLGAMRRRYTTHQFAETVEMVRRLIPGAGITTDLIVGFPGEGEQEFRESLGFAAGMAFSDMHIFPYSQRPGTSAVYLDGQAPEAVKRERVAMAIETASSSFAGFRKTQLGKERPVLWESQRHGDGGEHLLGLTDNYIRVRAATNPALRSVAILPNTITTARLTALEGKVVEAMPL